MKRGAVCSRRRDAVPPTWTLVFTSLLLTSGCGSGSSAGDITEELKTISSWAATAHMIADTWMAGSAPTAYTVQTLFEARRRLQEERSRIESRSVPAETRGEVVRQLDNLGETMNQMLSAIRKADRKALARQIGQLSAAAEAVASLAKGSQAQP